MELRGNSTGDPVPDITRIIEVIIGVAAIVVPLWWNDKKQREKQHQENLGRFEFLIAEQRERPNHRHPERTGQLYAENVQYGARKINGGEKV